MKKMSLLAAVLLCAVLLAACGGGESGREVDYSAGDLQAMADAGAFSESLEQLDGEMMFALYRLADYGLSQEDLAEAAALRSAGATCEEAAVLVLTQGDSDRLEKLEQALKDYVQGQIDANVDYRPAEIPKLEDALILCRGNSVLMVVANDLDAAQKALE